MKNIKISSELLLTYHYGSTIIHTDKFNTDYETNSYSKFYFIKKGKCYFYIGKESPIMVKKGSLLFVPAGTPHKRNYIDDNEKNSITLSWCHFHIEQKNSASLFENANLPYHIFLSDKVYYAASRLFTTMFRNSKNDDIMSRINLFSALFKLVQLYLHNATPNRSETQHDSLINKILSYISSNLSSQLKTRDVAAAVYLSENYLIRFFSKNIGMTPQRYIIKCKMELAMGLLENSENSISEIMNKIGFTDMCYFSKSFKKFSGHSPTQYRTKYGLSPVRSSGTVIE